MLMKLNLIVFHFVEYIIGNKECDVNITESWGVITSPNYPREYERSTDCTYIIHSPSRKAISLVIVDFQLEDDRACADDFIEISDGNSKALGRFCGDSIPDPVIALSGLLVIHFHSDSFWNYKGFKAIYNESADCNMVINETEGMIQSTNDTREYVDNLPCLFLIQSPNNLPINMSFSSFNVGRSSQCSQSSVKIKSSIGKSAKVIGTYCGVETPRIPLIRTGIVFIIHNIGKQGSDSGFSATFKEVTYLDCSGHLTVSSGRIQSPNYPEKYPPNQDCMYRLTSINGLPIRLTFTEFLLEGEVDDRDCQYDYVEIVNSSISIVKLCGDRNTPFNFTLSSTAVVKFHSDGTKGFKGFNAFFYEINEFTVTTERIFSTEMNTEFIPKLTVTESFIAPIITGSLAGVVGIASTVFVILYFVRANNRRRKTIKKTRHIPDNEEEHNHEDYNYVENRSSQIMVEQGSRDSTTTQLNDKDTYSEVNKQKNELNEYSYSELILGNRMCVSSDELDDDYVNQQDSYNVLTKHPDKITETGLYDRTVDDVYDTTEHTSRHVEDDGQLFDYSHISLQ